MSIYNKIDKSNSLLIVIEKYLKIIDTNFLTNRLSKLKKKHVTLICDVLHETDRSINREKLIHKPLCDLLCYDLIDKSQDINWNKSILNILYEKLPTYRIYYHYNYLASSSYKINYEITIYKGNIINDPWGKVLGCWQTEFEPLERNESKFDKEVIQ